MPQVFSNRASGTLAAGITAAATTLTLAAGNGARFPVMAAGDTFTAILQVGELDSDTREYVQVTARAGDVLTIVRAQEGSAAAAFPLGTLLALAVTAGVLATIQRRGAQGPNNDAIFYYSDKQLSASTVLPANTNVGAYGPLEVPSGTTLEVPAGSTLTIH